MDCSPISASIKGEKGLEASCFRVRFAESTVDEDGASVLPSMGKGMEVTVMVKKKTTTAIWASRSFHGLQATP